jgi:CheY-like chemotaxis protein
MPIRVLLADDSPAAARAVLNALPDPEFEVRTAADGGRAARAMAERMPDVLLAALALPGRSGYELGAMVRQDPDACGMALVFLQGPVETLDVNRLSGLDHDGVVRKPFDSAALAALVRRAVEKRREFPSLPEEPQVVVPAAPPVPPDPADPALGLEGTPLEAALRRLIREDKVRDIAAAEYRKRLVRELRREPGKK